MFIGAEQLVSPGGPSAPAWAFFTAISLGILTLIGQQIQARKASNEARIKASEAAKDAKQAQQNTENISNGFADQVVTELINVRSSTIQNTKTLDEIQNMLTRHLEWHNEHPN